MRFKTSNRIIAVALLCPVFLASEASQQPAAAENGREEQNLPQLVREPEIDVFREDDDQHEGHDDQNDVNNPLFIHNPKVFE